MMFWIEMIPIAASLLCFAAAAVVHASKSRGVRHPVYTEATVVDTVRQVQYRNRTEIERFAPRIRYMTEQGEQTVTSQHYMPEWQYRYQKGDIINICYQKDNPGRFQICRTVHQELCRNLFLIVGVGIIVAYAVLRLQYH